MPRYTAKMQISRDEARNNGDRARLIERYFKSHAFEIHLIQCPRGPSRQSVYTFKFETVHNNLAQGFEGDRVYDIKRLWDEQDQGRYYLS